MRYFYCATWAEIKDCWNIATSALWMSCGELAV
jgi:hypothetical protein